MGDTNNEIGNTKLWLEYLGVGHYKRLITSLSVGTRWNVSFDVYDQVTVSFLEPDSIL